jgi:hypothetical protein
MAMLNETLRSRWFSAGLHAGLWLLLLLAVIGIGGGRAPHFREAEADPTTVSTPVPVAKLEKLFTPTNWPKNVVDASSLNPFVTTYFMPTNPPPPPPPTTRKVELTYQGFYRTAEGPKYTLLRLGDALVSVPVGGRVVTNLYVIEATLQTLTLTNSAAQTNVLTLNTKKEVEVPLK